MRIRTTMITASVAALALLATAAVSQHAGHGSHGGHGAAPASASDSAATRAYKAANAKMHKDMDIRFTGDADVDFVRGMIPHHEGAVAMARIVLQHGKDPVIRKLAEEIVAAQDKEIALMQGWLKTKGQ
jgi:uncharacterized protein (DUF305 family)